MNPTAHHHPSLLCLKSGWYMYIHLPGKTEQNIAACWMFATPRVYAQKTTASACQSHQRGWSAFVRCRSPRVHGTDLASRLGKSGRKTTKKNDKNSGCVCFGCLLKSSYLIDLEGQVDLCQAEVPYCPISRKRDMMSSTDSGGLGCNKSLGDCWCHQLKLATSYIIVKGCYMHSCFPPNFPGKKVLVWIWNLLIIHIQVAQHHHLAEVLHQANVQEFPSKQNAGT